VDSIIHAAAECRQHLISYNDYYQTNCIATARLIDAAIKLKVRKFIYVSTANTIGYGIDTVGNSIEFKPMKSPFKKSFYARSKAAAEAYVLQQKDKIEVNIINPTFMIGAFDRKPGSGRIVLASLKHKMLFYPPGGKNFVPVKDVCAVIKSCIINGTNGKRYLAVGENLSYFQFFKTLQLLNNHHQFLIPIPLIILRILGLSGDILRFFNLKTAICSNNMDILCISSFYDNTQQFAESLINKQPLENAILESIRYFNTHHLKK
jgi:nucleoside-diphosphate-sugar epimerase